RHGRAARRDDRDRRLGRPERPAGVAGRGARLPAPERRPAVAPRAKPLSLSPACRAATLTIGKDIAQAATHCRARRYLCRSGRPLAARGRPLYLIRGLWPPGPAADEDGKTQEANASQADQDLAHDWRPSFLWTTMQPCSP